MWAWSGRPERVRPGSARPTWTHGGLPRVSGRCRPRAIFCLLLILAAIAACRTEAAPAPIRVGLIAPLSGASAASGEAIQRGLVIAIDEVNRDGGVLGRPLDLIVRDVPNDPDLGVAALREMIDRDRIVAAFGGIFSPVMLAQLDTIHQAQIPLISTWGSHSAITRNSRSPNYAFRVSVNDESADEFLARYAIESLGVRRPGILADTSAWGEANVDGLTAWFDRLGVTPAGIERFEQGEINVILQLERLRAAGADSLLMVANAPEGAAIVRGLVAIGWSVPIVSHWGISGGRFVELAGVENVEGIRTLQTFSFYRVDSPKDTALLRAYHDRFGTRAIEEIPAPVGVAHGYDALHLLARAIRQAGATSGPRVREVLERLAPHAGVVKQYEPAFTPDRHDALSTDDYIMAVWRAGQLRPADPAHLKR